VSWDMPTQTFDLSEAFANQRASLGRLGALGLGGSIAVAALIVLIVVRGRSDPFLYGAGAFGAAAVLGFGVLVYWLMGLGGLVSVTVDEKGLGFRRPKGPVRRLDWSNPNFNVEVYDASGLPASDELAQSVAPFPCGFGTSGTKGLFVRSGIPREAFSAMIAGARDHGLEVTRLDHDPRAMPTFRIRPPSPSVG
jgi:hypothetical protein